jgi:hypothetical protein
MASNIRLPVVLTTFRRFLDLPTELRVAIWQLCLPPPRIIDIRRLDLGHNSFSKKWLLSPLLHICRESRAEYTRSYKFRFCKRGNNKSKGVSFNLDLDTIYCTYKNLKQLASGHCPIIRADFCRIQSLELPMVTGGKGGLALAYRSQGFRKIRVHLTALKVLTLIYIAPVVKPILISDDSSDYWDTFSWADGLWDQSRVAGKWKLWNARLQRENSKHPTWHPPKLIIKLASGFGPDHWGRIFTTYDEV